MRLNNLSDEIFFDEFHEVHTAKHKIFLTSMMNAESLIILKNFSAMIYTSEKIAKQLLTYCHERNMQLRRSDFFKLVPNKPTKIELEDGSCLEAIMFESEEVNRNVVFMFRKDKKTTHVYAGVCTEFRSLVLNDIFAEWVRGGVENLYVDVSHATSDKYDLCELQNTIDFIANIQDSYPDYMIIINVPKFGYEKLVYHLSYDLRARVKVGGIMSAVFKIVNKEQHLALNLQDARILIVNKCFTMEEIKRGYEKDKYIFIKIVPKSVNDSNQQTVHPGLYELSWSPLPTAFDLMLLASVLHPDRIYAINHNSISLDAGPRVPQYLLKLSNEYPQIEKRIEREEDCEAEVIEEICSIRSSNASSNGSTSDALMKLTQDAKAHDPVDKVQEWLTSEVKISENENQKVQNNNTGKKKNIEIKEKLKSKKTPDPPNTFCIPKRSLKYLEDSDSS